MNGIKKSANMDVFSWLPEFRSKCRSRLGSGTSTLIELIRTFNRNISSNVSESFKNPSLASRLKDLIQEYLLLFMHLYRYEQPQDQNREDYLEQMSDLLAVYIDLELVASTLVAGLLQRRISAGLISYLCVCLDNSIEHVLDTLMKIHFVNANFCHILESVFSKVLKLIPPKPQSSTMYVRYFLVYLLWQRMYDKLVVKPQPPLTAEALLGPVPAKMPEFLLKEVLCQTSCRKTSTEPVDFYLRQCVHLQKACAEFQQYCRGRDAPKASSKDDITERDKRLKSTNTSVSNKLTTVNTNFSKSSNSGVKSLPSSSASNVSLVNSNFAKPRRPTAPAKIPPKTGDVEVIDLTSDEESRPTSNGRRRPAPRRRLGWLARAVQGVEAKIRESSLKRELAAPTEEEHRTEDAPRRSVEEVEARGPEERPEIQQVEESSVDPREQSELKLEAEPVESAPLVDAAAETLRPCEEDRLNPQAVSPLEEPTAREVQCRAEVHPEKDRADSGFSESDVPEGNESDTRSRFYDLQEAGLSGLTLLACVLTRLTEDERTDVAAPQEHPPVGASTAEKSDVAIVEENQCHVEPKPRSEEKEARVSNEVGEIDAAAARNKQLEASESEARNGFYDIKESPLNGLTLLTCVLSTQTPASNKNAEIKVKPYASMQEKLEPENRVVDRIVSICPEDALDKVALQVEVSSSSEMEQSRPQPEFVSYPMDDPVQSSLESNENAHVILNGETVRLMQKSPNSNLYIINKAAVDVSKMNYNSDEEDGGKPIEPEESKCCPQSLMIKHEPDDVGLLRGRSIKPDPDYVGQPHDIHYPGHPGYCGYAPKIQPASASCACPNCVYNCRQLPYYLSAQPVQANPAVQEKRCLPTPPEASLYEEQLMKQQQPQLLEPAVESSKIADDKFSRTENKLPLKKRLMAQCMSMSFVEQPAPAYPGTLMMSIADVELRPGQLELGAEVEIAAATVKTSKSRSGKEAKVKNQNMPDCFPRKGGAAGGRKKKTPEEEEEEQPSLAASAPKKARKSGAKQTRSSRRTVPSVNYVYPEIDPEWNPSGKRKRKRTSR